MLRFADLAVISVVVFIATWAANYLFMRWTAVGSTAKLKPAPLQGSTLIRWIAGGSLAKPKRGRPKGSGRKAGKAKVATKKVRRKRRTKAEMAAAREADAKWKAEGPARRKKRAAEIAAERPIRGKQGRPKQVPVIQDGGAEGTDSDGTSPVAEVQAPVERIRGGMFPDMN